MRKLVAVVVVLGLAASAYAAVGDYGIWRDNRDWSNAQGDGLYANKGLSNSCRVSKGAYQEGLTLDWDTQAILDWMTANPVGENEQYKFTLWVASAGSWNTGWPSAWDGADTYAPVRMKVRSLNLGNGTDWVEGDGCDGGGGGCGADFNFSPGTPAATDAYAQTYWTLVNFIPTLDVDNCVPWTDLNGTTYDSFRGAVPNLFGGSESTNYIEVDCSDPVFLAAQAGAQFSVELDYDPDHVVGTRPAPIINDLLEYEDNRGLLFSPMEYYDTGTASWLPLEWVNGTFYTLQQDNPNEWPDDQHPLLHVEIVPGLPIPGDTNDDGWVDGADYTNWADNYLSSPVPAWEDGGWTVGNFNADDTVDGADYTVWADNYNPPPPGGAVPEPATLSLLILGACLPLFRRRGR